MENATSFTELAANIYLQSEKGEEVEFGLVDNVLAGVNSRDGWCPLPELNKGGRLVYPSFYLVSLFSNEVIRSHCV